MKVLNQEELEVMETSCALAAETLLFVGDIIAPGMTTAELDKRVHDFIVERKAYPSPLNYHGFPKSICTSRNNVMCHGIPHSKETLLDGDIINVDISTYYPIENGFHGDTSAMFYIGEPSDDAKHLVEVTRECLKRGIVVVKPGARVGDIGHAIQSHAEANGCSVVRDFVGHGVGRVFHGDPQIVHVGNPGEGSLLREGMIFTIEPIINLGSSAFTILSEDDWTVLTRDGSLSAQFEHTVLVTEDGFRILTERDRVLKNSEDLDWVLK